MKLQFVLIAGLTLITTACANQNPYVVTVSNCPALAVLGDAGTVTRFVGNGRDTGDVAYTATISSAVQSCTENDGGIETIVEFDIVATSGAALINREVTLQYFVAEMKDTSQLVSKKIFDVTLNFNASTGTASSHQIIKSTIPTLEQAKRYDYETLLGFQLTNDEAAYNIAR